MSQIDPETVSSLQERLSKLEAWARRLSDEQEICRLVCSYGPTVDSGQSLAGAQLWTDDGTYESDLIEPCIGQKELVALFESDLHQGLIRAGAAHVMSYPVVVVDGDRAVATNYARVYRYEDGVFVPWRVVASRWECLRTALGWRIKRRINAQLNGSESARQLLGRFKEP